MQQDDNYRYWSTTVTIPLLDARSAKAFMEMVFLVAKLADVPKQANWCVETKGNKYLVIAKFTQTKFYPLKERPKFKIRPLK